MSKGGSVTVGYWYKMALHFGLCSGPIDYFLEFRGGDRTAWQGALPSSGIIPVVKPDLWGGEKAEGGINGLLEVMFGTADQGPNAWLAANLGPDQPGYRRKATVLFHGDYGAMSPYPKPPAFKINRVFNGWDNGCWYPAKASVPWPGGPVTSGGGGGSASKYLSAPASTDVPNAEALVINCQKTDVVTFSGEGAWCLDVGQVSQGSYYLPWKRSFYIAHGSGATDWAGGSYATEADALDADIKPISITGYDTYYCYIFTLHPEVASGGVTVNASWAGESRTDEIGIMNPAHILYDSLTAADMMGEPVGLINDASFRAAADKLYTEGFGLCTTFDATSESITDFQQRICNVIGASLSRSRVNGQWYLDLLRGDYALADLPVLTDDDILEWSAQPGTLDSAVNQVAVEWFDPTNKETRTTAPCQALGLIQAFGGIKSDTSSYPEVPYEALALRCAARDLRNKATPVTRFELKTTRTPYGWRPGTCFRLQAPKRGIADMVCRVGEIDTGTIRQGAITLTAVQDVFGLAASSYVSPETGIDTRPSRTPKPAPAQLAFEAPYTEIVQRLSKSDLAQTATDAGFLLFVAAQPEKALNYTLATVADGEEYAQRAGGDWCPTALVAADASYLDTAITITGGSLLDRVNVGSAALWDSEIVRVDAIDVAAGTLTLGRGCVDTVPAKHAKQSRIWFFDDSAASDRREYVAGEKVSARCLTRTGGALLSIAAAPISSVVMADRWARPYPPAGVKINGTAYPVNAAGNLVLTWVHRNRVSQADKLIDAAMGSISPEAGTTYTATLTQADTGAVLDTQAGIAGATATFAGEYHGKVNVELASVRDGLKCLQPWQWIVQFAAAAADPYWANVVLAMHFDGADGSINFIDETGKTVTPGGNAKISTVKSWFGGSSGYFDGDTDYLYVVNNGAFNFASQDFCIEFGVYKKNLNCCVASLRTSPGAAQGLGVWIDPDGVINFVAGSNGWTVNILTTLTVPAEQFTHVACVRHGNVWCVYIGGRLAGTQTVSVVVANTTGQKLWIGSSDNGAWSVPGYLDEVRITVGVPRYTGEFTPPTAAFSKG